MTIWIMSAHGHANLSGGGGRGAAVQLIQVPAGVEFWTYSSEATVARVPMDALDRLLVGCKPGQTEDELLTQTKLRKHSGPAIPSYVMTFTDEWGNDKLGYPSSGIFIAGDPLRTNPNAWTPQPHVTYALKTFFEDPAYLKRGDKIAWLCCRVWMSQQKGQFIDHFGGAGRWTNDAPESRW